MRAYQAYGSDGSRVTASTPKAAALKFFENFRDKRKCNITEGDLDGNFFVVSFSRNRRQNWKDVTEKTIHILPE